MKYNNKDLTFEAPFGGKPKPPSQKVDYLLVAALYHQSEIRDKLNGF